MEIKCKCRNCGYRRNNLIYDEDESHYFVKCTRCNKYFFVKKEKLNGEKKEENK